MHEEFVPVPDPPLNPLFETAQSALDKSCYLTIDWRIHETSSVKEAVKRMAGHNIGALAVTDDSGKVVGVLSERDYLKKVALLGRSSDSTTVKEICTYGDNLISVSRGNPIDMCMDKMLRSDVRHLLVRNAKDDPSIVGMISIKDIVKCNQAKSQAMVNRLEEIVQYQTLGV